MNKGQNNISSIRSKFEQQKSNTLPQGINIGRQRTPTNQNTSSSTSTPAPTPAPTPVPTPAPTPVVTFRTPSNQGQTQTNARRPTGNIYEPIKLTPSPNFEKEKNAKRLTVFVEDDNKLRTQARPPKPKPDVNRQSVMYVNKNTSPSNPPQQQEPSPPKPVPVQQKTEPVKQAVQQPVQQVQATPPPKEEPKMFHIHEQWKIDYSELEFDELISEGSAGEVYLGYYFGTPVAIKKLFAVGPDQRHLVEREYSMLKDVNHPNVIQFFGICNHESGIYLITEYIENGDLFDLLVFDSEKIYDKWKTKVKISLQIAQGVFYLHSRNVIHRDLKSQNVLIGENNKVKLCDLGLATIVENKKRMTVCGTDEWMAPEIAIAESYDYRVDVFSFGIILTEIITCQPPAKRTIQNFLAFDEKNFLNCIPPGCPEDLKQLVLDCTRFKPEQRPSFKEIVPRLRKLLNSLPEDE